MSRSPPADGYGRVCIHRTAPPAKRRHDRIGSRHDHHQLLPWPSTLSCTPAARVPTLPTRQPAARNLPATPPPAAIMSKQPPSPRPDAHAADLSDDDDLDDDLLAGVLGDLAKPATATATATAKPAPASGAAPSAPTPAAAPAAASAPASDDPLADDLMRELAANMAALMGAGNDGDGDDALQKAMAEMLQGMEGMGLGEPAAAPAPAPTAETGKSFQDRVRRTVDKLQDSDKQAEASQAASAGTGGAEDMDSLMAEMMKQMESLADSSEFESVLEGMMESLMSKDILHEPLKDLAAKYPAYLEANKSALPADEYAKYEKQYALITEICVIYDAGREEEEAKKIVALMTEVQDLGQPPAELLKELAPGTEVDPVTGIPNLPADAMQPPPECNPQ
ncbi:hypothetical protein AMAG_15110 [Allomyces macrogynus ATCC 38327]|uniref:Pex19 protein n=1 Tax=Allomyces macrogynus (strain ATCC 38327) TaxID=578462 RepID=A0A0L0T5R4_ALLM3|nr:hypothetical protein AMAG_15110 [Allomyces macrogynus ATCC 38327]|eukprot:KNE70133.1 hypothetical protein AMAG_15110 [Allomyces macrogynus ATCC 38327]